MSADHNAASLPTLDLSRFDAGADEKRAFVEELRRVAREVGFFYLTGHGVDPELIRNALGFSRRFFDLPEADKLAIEMIHSPRFRGYTRPGRELTRGEPDWREQIDVGAERPALPAKAIKQPWHRLQGPNQWPEALPDLKPTLLAYQDAVTALAIRVLRTFAVALDQPEDVFEPIYTPWPNQLTKVIRYPGRGARESNQGVGAHKDGGFVTILLQDKVAGLQVEAESGWIDAPPLAGSFIVNIGEILEIATSGFLRATLHRVVSPSAGSDRLSIGFFLGAHLDARVPLLNLPPHLAALSRGVTQDPLNPLFSEVGRNVLKGRLRSHPDVAVRHHADLLALTRPQHEPASFY
ncbi:2-oxoglutarate and iron-dependent oxygenase domain-containing protein [uncultured Rhodoblastus sp.]|uniref:isopenicillin N synthase family dioxygenase n=1 Tax=uncultured Rhodoblastus sp. TaxID=543037 RepID=UPI0025E81D77|nr:2-oxoglutarate and iron-dependent oxygenase domain-containing protein [uncultured Rhodoblastus sp.]